MAKGFDAGGGGLVVAFGRNAGGTEFALPLDNTKQLLKCVDPALASALAGSSFCRWINKFTPGSGTLVGTHSSANGGQGLYYNIPVGAKIAVHEVCVELLTNEDSIYFQLGYTSRGTAAGTFTPLTPWHYLESGMDELTAWSGADKKYRPPLMVDYNAGTAECITMRFEANDASAEVVPAWRGYKVL